MSDFEAALREKLSRNAELAEERAQAEQEMDRAQQEAQRRAEEERAAYQRAAAERHEQLVARLREAANALKAASPDSFVVRMGWTASGEEFIAKITSRQLSPARSLLVELDRDDDEVLARWHSDLGNSLELWRLLECEPGMLDQLVLQVADQDLWRTVSRPPAFPTAEDGERTDAPG
ncbi:hypothetical protein ER308_03145 [Egibacter rhizosphaerae]|uniref:Uncharacterized protein n=1 Tax=Egibacter rhizosphaerae TaxID=1670831 RepID=A0A411YBW6_9ACTN|nr:hypothetical protein [Egibacter rhizosphaerae]QBI18652.1 hypothetical protein ER308_03145 [Egibacter rhizosphaerae]